MIYALTDTETTNLVQALGCPLSYQPHIIEVGIILINSEFKTIKKYESLVKPPISIPPYITKITGISDYHVRYSPKFKKISNKISKLFKKADFFVAHNATFDYAMYNIEAQRINANLNLPKKLICTAEQSFHFNGHRLKLDQLFEELGYGHFKKHHRAMADTKVLIKILKGIGYELD